MKQAKRMLSILLIALLTLGTFAVAASANTQEAVLNQLLRGDMLISALETAFDAGEITTVRWMELRLELHAIEQNIVGDRDLDAMWSAGEWAQLLRIYTDVHDAWETALGRAGVVPRYIFSTRWEANWRNWLLFFFGFGFIWMWF